MGSSGETVESDEETSSPQRRQPLLRAHTVGAFKPVNHQMVEFSLNVFNDMQKVNRVNKLRKKVSLYKELRS